MHFRPFAAAVIGIFSLAASTVAQDAARSAPADQRYRSANGLLQRGLYDMAAAEYEQFLASQPDRAQADTARYGLAVCRFRTSKLDEALAQLEQIEPAEEFPFRIEVGLLTAQCHLTRGQHAEAVAALAEVVRSAPQHELADDAVALLCEALYGQGKYAEAIDLCRQFAKTWPENPLRERVEFVRALSAMAGRDYADAGERLETWLTTYPKSAPATHAALLAGQCHLHSRSLDAAAKRFREVLDAPTSPHMPEALLGLATVQYQKDAKAESATLLETLASKYADHVAAPTGQLLRARVLIDADQLERALALLEPLAAKDGPQSLEAGYRAAKCLLRLNKPADAAARLAVLAERSADSALAPEIRYDLAMARLKTGEVEAVLRDLAAFQTAFPKHELAPETLYLTASALHQTRKYDESKTACAEFVRQYAGHERLAAVLFLAAENEFLTGRYAEALAAYERFAQAFPVDPIASRAELRIGLALHRLERFDDAEPSLARVVKANKPEPATLPVWLALADIYFQRSDWKQAEPLLREYLAAFAVSAGAAPPSTPASSAADDAWLKLGLCRLRQGDAEGALTAFDALLEKHAHTSHRLQATFERGQALVALKKEDLAKQAFEQVLAEGPDSRFALYANQHLAALAARGQDFKAAAQRYRLVVDAQPGTAAAADAQLRRGEALQATQDYDGAEESFRAYLAFDRASAEAPRAAAQLAIALSRQDRHADALGIIEEAGLNGDRAAKLEPALVSALRQEQAWCLRKVNKPEEAATVYAALLQSPGGERNAAALLELAELEAAAEKTAAAVELLRKLRALVLQESSAATPEIVELALYRLGVCEFKLQRFAEAAAALEELIQKFPNSKLTASAGYFCGEAHFRTNAHDKAAVHLARVTESHSADPAAGPSLLRLGEALAILQRWPRSERCFAEYLEKFADSDNWFQARFGMGWARENQSRYDEAIDAYREIVARHQGPTAARAQFQIGECLLAKKQYEEAARELLKVDILYAYPEWSAAALYEAGRCFELLGKPVEARAQFEAVQSKYKESKWGPLAAQRLEALQGGGLPGRAARL